MWPFDRKKTKQEAADKVTATARAEEQQKARKLAMRRAVMKSMELRASDNAKKWAPPELMPGVVPAGTTPAVAMDSLCGPTYQFLNSAAGGLYAGLLLLLGESGSRCLVGGLLLGLLSVKWPHGALLVSVGAGAQ